MSTSSCTNQLVLCELTFPPAGSSSDPETSWACPQGAYITHLTSGECTTCGNPLVGCIEQVRCSDGSLLIGTAGDCTTDTNPIISDCSGLKKGIAGFGGRSGSNFDKMTVICGNGDTAASPVFNNDGSQFQTQTCPSPTHRMSAIRARSANSSSRVKYLEATCNPLQNICVGATLNDPACFEFCNINVGACDSALLSYCSDPTNYGKPICGCAKPASQYATLNLISQSSGIALPVACDAACASALSIRTATSGICNVGTICVQNDIDITVVQSQLGGGITLTQNCGGVGGGGTTSSFFTSPAFYIILGIIVLLLIAIIIIILVVQNNKNKRLEAERRDELRRRAVAAQRPQVVRI